MKSLIKPLLRWAGYELKPLAIAASINEQYSDVTEREWQIYSKVKDFTMVSLERIVTNIRAADYVSANKIPGDIVECGVWRGGSSMAMALALKDQLRTLWMYDTYSGMTDATDTDMTSTGLKASLLLEEAKQDKTPEGTLLLAFASLRDVQRNMQTTGYPSSRINFIQGAVERTIPSHMPEEIALLRIDTDWYESTRHELKHLYPRLSSGGVLIVDDYGYWKGARKAVDEYFEGKLFLHRIDYTGRLAIKP
jgi:O-methyltransferase